MAVFSASFLCWNGRLEVRIRLKLLGRAAVLTWTGRLKSIRLLRLLQTPVLDAHLDGQSLLQAGRAAAVPP